MPGNQAKRGGRRRSDRSRGLGGLGGLLLAGLIGAGWAAGLPGFGPQVRRGLAAADQPAVTDDDPLPGEQPAGGAPGAAGAAVPEGKASKELFSGVVIACLGDDWTLPNPQERTAIKSYPEALAHLFDRRFGHGYVTIRVAGKAGATMSDLEAIYKKELEKYLPDIVIVEDSGVPEAAADFRTAAQRLAAGIKGTRSKNGRTPKVVFLDGYAEVERDPQHPEKFDDFRKAHEWFQNDAALEEIAGREDGIFVPLRVQLTNAMQELKLDNYTVPFKPDGETLSYMGSELVALRILDRLGEDVAAYNMAEFNYSERVKAAMVAWGQGKTVLQGKIHDPAEDALAAGPQPAPELAHFGKALRTAQPTLVAYFGGDEMARAAWVAQNAVFLKRVYGDKVDTFNAAREGDTSAGGLKRMEMDVLKFKPRLLLIAFGFDDARDAAKVSVEDSRKNLTAMIALTRKLDPDSDIVLVTGHALNTWGEGEQRRSDLAAYYKAMREVAAAEKCGLIDNAPEWNDWAANNPDKYREVIGKGLLPNLAGQTEMEKIAEQWFAAKFPFAKKK
ncbi:MAG: GDSL-type esterase/lipase family protein [Planctomycetota bacterium]